MPTINDQNVCEVDDVNILWSKYNFVSSFIWTSIGTKRHDNYTSFHKSNNEQFHDITFFKFSDCVVCIFGLTIIWKIYMLNIQLSNNYHENCKSPNLIKKSKKLLGKLLSNKKILLRFYIYNKSQFWILFHQGFNKMVTGLHNLIAFSKSPEGWFKSLRYYFN